MHFSVAVGEAAVKVGNEKESEATLEGRDIKVHDLRAASLKAEATRKPYVK